MQNLLLFVTTNSPNLFLTIINLLPSLIQLNAKIKIIFWGDAVHFLHRQQISDEINLYQAITNLVVDLNLKVLVCKSSARRRGLEVLPENFSFASMSAITEYINSSKLIKF